MLPKLECPILRKQLTTNVREDEGKGESSVIFGVFLNECNHLGNQYADISQLYHFLAYTQKTGYTLTERLVQLLIVSGKWKQHGG